MLRAAWRSKLADRLTDQWRAPNPGLAAQALRPLSWAYAALTAAHRSLYTVGLMQSVAVPRPILVVGNLVVGGAGKTPAVMAIARWLRATGRNPGVISRGHGRRSNRLLLVNAASTPDEVGDEPLLIHLRSGVPVAVGADRAAAAAFLCQQCPQLDIIVADDGLQHHRLRRDVELLLFDDSGVGNGLLLPAGPLRQRLPTQPAAHQLVLYTNGRQSTALPGYLGTRSLTGVLPLAHWWRDPAAAPQALASLRGRPLLAAAGVAQPAAFFDLLSAAGLDIRRLPLADHHDWRRLPWSEAAPEVIVTEKDAVKLRPQHIGAGKVWVATLDFQPDPAFFAALSASLCFQAAAQTAPHPPPQPTAPP